MVLRLSRTTSTKLNCGLTLLPTSGSDTLNRLRICLWGAKVKNHDWPIVLAIDFYTMKRNEKGTDWVPFLILFCKGFTKSIKRLYGGIGANFKIKIYLCTVRIFFCRHKGVVMPMLDGQHQKIIEIYD